MRTPDYQLTSDFTWGYGSDLTRLSKGAFVRPIELRYIPKHVTDATLWSAFNPEFEVYCYTAKGIVAIPRRLLVSV